MAKINAGTLLNYSGSEYTEDLSELSQKIDLKEITGVDIENDPNLRGKIAQEIVDYIKNRTTDKNNDISGNKFKEYSKSYIDSFYFKATGKSPGDVNLTLFGDMLGTLDVIGEAGNLIEVGINNPKQARKAYGHQTGFEGHPNEDMKKFQRAFFGITKKEISEKILPKFEDEIANISKQEPSDATRLARFLINAGDLFKGEL